MVWRLACCEVVARNVRKSVSNAATAGVRLQARARPLSSSASAAKARGPLRVAIVGELHGRRVRCISVLQYRVLLNTNVCTRSLTPSPAPCALFPAPCSQRPAPYALRIPPTPSLSATHSANTGSGPAGMYTARTLLRKVEDVEVDVIEMLPTPFGLVRYGEGRGAGRVAQSASSPLCTCAPQLHPKT